jgi:hypothetical protein
MNIVVLDDALGDLVDGYRFYEQQERGIGDYFLACLYSDIEALRLYAGIHQKAFGFYRSLSKRFPFVIYYDVKGDTARIFAVLDGRRDPGAILVTLSGRRR